MENIHIKTSDTHWARIYLSGPIAVIEQACREECKRAGLCVTVEPIKFIYSGGEEMGAVVGLVNYPRYPVAKETLNSRSRTLAIRLLENTFQNSAMVMTPEKTEWVTNRKEEGGAA